MVDTFRLYGLSLSPGNAETYSSCFDISVLGLCVLQIYARLGLINSVVEKIECLMADSRHTSLRDILGACSLDQRQAMEM